MTGSVVDGEDVVQEALVKAYSAWSRSGDIADVESWLFRIAHNASLDFLRRRARRDAVSTDEEIAMAEDPLSTVENHEIVATSLRTFMRLPVVQRSSVILMDVLGYPLTEIGTIMSATVPAVKSALHRGRERLRALAAEPQDREPVILGEREQRLLQADVSSFNARDFDAIRRMIADEIRLDLVNKTRMKGREVYSYFSNYESTDGWRVSAGVVEGHPAVFVYESANAAVPSYFILLHWDADRLTNIRDFRYARYVMDSAEWGPVQ